MNGKQMQMNGAAPAPERTYYNKSELEGGKIYYCRISGMRMLIIEINDGGKGDVVALMFNQKTGHYQAEFIDNQQLFTMEEPEQPNKPLYYKVDELEISDSYYCGLSGRMVMVVEDKDEKKGFSKAIKTFDPLKGQYVISEVSDDQLFLFVPNENWKEPEPPKEAKK